VRGPYELVIGLRYLYTGRPSRTLPLVVAATLTAVSIALVLGSGKPSPWGVAGMTVGALATISLGLLRIFSVFTTVSVAGVVLGVAALTVVLSVTSGFQHEFQKKVLGVNAHVLVMRDAADFINYRDIQEMAENLPGVVAVQPFSFDEMIVTRGRGELSGVAVKGVDPKQVAAVLDLPSHIVEGSIDVLGKKVSTGEGEGARELPQAIIGRELARKLKAKVGDVVTIVTPLSGIDGKTWQPSGKPPKIRKFVVGAIFYSGFEEYDRRLMYVDLAETQDFMERGDVVLGIELKLADHRKAGDIAALLTKRLGGQPWIIMDWQALNRNLFSGLKIQKLILTILLTLILIVAAFNLVSSLAMQVIDKTKEIAILKSMGCNWLGVARIFIIVGVMIGLAGTVLGVALGLLLCHVIARYGYPLDPKVYMIDRLPIQVNPDEVVLVVFLTFVICALATIYPAWRSASLHPVDGLRAE
jgi:lipoprotein-releasing system permease protein